VAAMDRYVARIAERHRALADVIPVNADSYVAGERSVVMLFRDA
jgi:hypothetical protein